MQDVSSTTDLVSALGDYVIELIAVDLTISGAPEAGGTDFTRATVDTAGVSGDSSLQLRLPTTVWDSYSLVSGCSLRVTGTPLWRFFANAQISAWDGTEISGVTCP